MDIFQLEIRLSRHAFDRADERGIDLEEINWCIHTGKKITIGKNTLKFVKEYEDSKIECICQIRSDCIFIITVTRSKK
jgi:hypothetical protein